MKKLSVLIIACLFIFACEDENGSICDLTATIDETPWANDVIDEIIARQVYRFVHDNKYLYYFMADCCDQFDPVYDCDGNFICAPTGGLAGTGDGQCPNYDLNNDSVLIWTP